jgi:hypothetical protein
MQSAAAEQDQRTVGVLTGAAAASGDHETIMRLTDLATEASLRSLDSLPKQVARPKRIRAAR